MAFIYRYHRHNTALEQRHDTLIDAIEHAVSDSRNGDACPGDIVSDAGEVILNQRNLLLLCPGAAAP